MKGLTDTLVTDAEEAHSMIYQARAGQCQPHSEESQPRRGQEGTDGIKKKQMRRIEKSAARIERSCEAAETCCLRRI